MGYGRIEWRGASCHLPQRAWKSISAASLKSMPLIGLPLLRNAGITSGLVELAGDVAVIGSQGDETPWSVAIRDPGGSGSLCSVRLVDAALATSGNYARTLAYNGKEYGHLLDPRSGWPVSGPDSVSVIDAQCLTAGRRRNVACLKHQDEAIDWLHMSQLPWLLCNAEMPPIGPVADTLTTASG